VQEVKYRAAGWLYLIAVLAVAVALFVPLPTLDWSLPVLKKAKPFHFVPLLAWFLAAAVFWGLRVRFWPNDARERRRLSSVVLLIVLQAALLRIVFELAAAYTPLPWSWLPPDPWVWIPWFLVPGLTGILLGGRFGVLASLAGALMLYLLADPGPWPLMGCLTSALVGVLLLRRSPARSRVLRAGTLTGGVLGIVAAFHYVVQKAPLDAVSAAFLVPLSLGVLSAFLVLAVLPVLEWMLGELSDITLIEYGTDHRLLDELRTKAPGTWHHSLNVADLAEKAAAEIGARAFFCKTAALYHDIGKLKDPALFAENNDGPSPHDQLEPHVSAQRIIEHVPHGIELARKHRLPKPFRDIIAEHHGVSAVRFFYAKACQPQPDGSQPSVDRALFCYPGPTPSTRESGILALADAVEAASRSFPSRAEADLRSFVSKLLADRISEGELAQCPLTLSDLAKVEAAFVHWLKARNHYRPAYPETSTGGPIETTPDHRADQPVSS
jgi:putative nucleotidyltransferase with HDIG domain